MTKKKSKSRRGKTKPEPKKKGTPPGAKRGRYAHGTKDVDAEVCTNPGQAKRRLEYYTKIRAEVDALESCEDDIGTDALIVTQASLMVALDYLDALGVDATGDELRCRGGLAGKIRNGFDELGLGRPKKEELGEL